MKFCLCIKPNDNNLLHIVARKDLKRKVYRAYRVIATVKDETAAHAAVAGLVQDYCDAHGYNDFSHFADWIREDHV